MKKTYFFGLLLISSTYSLQANDNTPSSSEPSYSKIADPFTYNLNPVGKYLEVFLLLYAEKKALQSIHKLSDSAKIEQANWEKVEQECDEFLLPSIKGLEATCKTIIADLPDYFELLLNPATGILN